MSKKLIIIAAAIAILVGVESLFAEEESAKAKPETQNAVRAKQGHPRRGNLDQFLDKLTKAYEENDRETMGQLLNEMNEQRKQMRQKKPYGIGRKRQRGHGRRWAQNRQRPYANRGLMRQKQRGFGSSNRGMRQRSNWSAKPCVGKKRVAGCHYGMSPRVRAKKMQQGLGYRTRFGSQWQCRNQDRFGQQSRYRGNTPISRSNLKPRNFGFGRGMRQRGCGQQDYCPNKTTKQDLLRKLKLKSEWDW